ncbi:MAG TPA: hypothetical protein VFV84_06180 [Burkholderiales bacterium]|nr:hypothetical protein [Burkholderiales bacterium]
MRRIALLALAALLLAQVPALAQRPEGARNERRDTQTRPPDRRESFTRERSSPRERQREERFTPAEREKLRQDLNEANREMRGKGK